MNGEEIIMAGLVVILVIGSLLSGVIGLIVAIVALKKANRLERQMERPEARTVSYPEPPPVPAYKPAPPKPAAPAPAAAAADKWPELIKPVVKPPIVQQSPLPPITQPKYDSIFTASENSQEETGEDEFEIIEPKKANESFDFGNVSLEQFIGIKGLLAMGILAVIVGVGFFLKYAYDNALIGPLGRVMIAVFWGFAALVIGEMTRKRGYGIVAKSVTALGFAILYAAVFSAYRFYNLIPSTAAFALAIIVTIAAMLYAVALNEIWMAVLSLLGGFITPILLSTGENLPVPLFIYVLILGMGAMLCAYYRRWRAVNLLAFAGTFMLYTGWFEKFFRQQLAITGQVPEQMTIALGWLAVFFAVYMTLPIFNGLVRRLKVQKEDVALILSNAFATFYYLWTILYSHYRVELAFCAIGMCAAHLVMMCVVARRREDDISLRLSLLAISLFFLTIAVPLYFKLYAVAIAWAAEAVILTLIGFRYKSIWTQLCGGVAFCLSLGQLINSLPMHRAAFTLCWNPAFGAWMFAVAAAVICHILYRRKTWILEYYRNIFSQIIYCAAGVLFVIAASMEWHYHCRYNLDGKNFSEAFFINGMISLFVLLIMLLVVRPVCPKGWLCKAAAMVVSFVGAAFVIANLPESYYSKFSIFMNYHFGFAVLFVAAIFAAAWFLRRSAGQIENDIVYAYIPAIAAIFVLFILISEEIYLYWWAKHKYLLGTENWRFYANMYMSIAWAAYAFVLTIIGFWRKISAVRYISLGFFGLLLLKVFILDMSTVKSVYRIAAFLATGVTLVGVSYLYQCLKKKGFFDAIAAEK